MRSRENLTCENEQSGINLRHKARKPVGNIPKTQKERVDLKEAVIQNGKRFSID